MFLVDEGVKFLRHVTVLCTSCHGKALE